MKYNLDPLPKHRDTRIKEGFLIIPKEIQGQIRWLEHATWLQRYCEYGQGFWEDIKWID